MYTHEEKLKAIKLYLKYESYAAVINELEYPSRGSLRNWINEHKQHGDVKKKYTRRSKYSEKQKQMAVNHYLEYGKCYSRTCRMLGYPSRVMLKQWVMESAPQPRQFRRNVVNLTSNEKEASTRFSNLMKSLSKNIYDQNMNKNINMIFQKIVKTMCTSL